MPFTGKGLIVWDRGVHTTKCEELHQSAKQKREMKKFLQELKREFHGEHALTEDGIAEAIAGYFDEDYVNLPQTFDGYNRRTDYAVDVKSSTKIITQAEIDDLERQKNPSIEGITGKQLAAIRWLAFQKQNVYFLKIQKDATGEYRCLKYHDHLARPLRGDKGKTVMQAASASSEHGFNAAIARRQGLHFPKYSTDWKKKVPKTFKSGSRQRKKY
jgi:hypothetical protein